MERTDFEAWNGREVARLLALVENQRRYYQDMVASLPVGLVVLSATRTVVSANRAFRQTLGLRIEDLRGKAIEQILPSDRLNMKQQLSLGRPLIFGVRTHGLGNSNYPGYSSHYEQAGWSVSHYLVVTGYDQADTYILNDPGLTRGHAYHISYDQLMHAVDDLDQAYPSLNAGRVFLVLAPASLA